MHFLGDNNDSPVDIDSRLDDVCFRLIWHSSQFICILINFMGP